NAVAGAVGYIDESRATPRRQRDKRQHQPQLPHDARIAAHCNLPALVRGGGYARPMANTSSLAAIRPPRLRPRTRANLGEAKAQELTHAPSRPLPASRRYSGRAAAVQR